MKDSQANRPSHKGENTSREENIYSAAGAQCPTSPGGPQTSPPSPFMNFSQKVSKWGKPTAWLVVLYFSCCVVIIYLPASLTCLYIRLQGSGLYSNLYLQGLLHGWLSTLFGDTWGVTVSITYSVMYTKCPVCTMPFIDRQQALHKHH